MVQCYIAAQSGHQIGPRRFLAESGLLLRPVRATATGGDDHPQPLDLPERKAQELRELSHLESLMDGTCTPQAPLPPREVFHGPVGVITLGRVVPYLGTTLGSWDSHFHTSISDKWRLLFP